MEEHVPLKNYNNLISKQVIFWAVILGLILCIATPNVWSQPAKQWDKTFGTISYEGLNTLKQTPDGGYILGGVISPDATGSIPDTVRRGINYWVVKISANGIKEWDRIIGGNDDDELFSLQLSTDGGYILGGTSNSSAEFDKSENPKGGSDYWVVKLSSNGLKQWDKTIGGGGNENLRSIDQTSDGGYILGGYSDSNASGDKSENNKGVGNDYWVVKLSANGTKVWDKTIGSNSQDNLTALIRTTDNGFLLGGYSNSGLGSDKTQGSKGGTDYWIVKLTGNGVKEWDKSLGSGSNDELHAIKQTADGGYMVGGRSESIAGGDKTEGSKGDYDFWVLKLTSNGATQWDKTIGGSYADNLISLLQVADGSFILGGNSESPSSGDKTEGSRGDLDYWIVKLTANGVKVWDKTIGGSGFDDFTSLQQTSDGGYILGGTSDSNAGQDKTENSIGNQDMWVVKLASESTPNQKLSFTSEALTFNYTLGNSVAPQSVTLSANIGNPPVAITKSANSQWLSLSSGVLGPISFSIITTGLSTGTYNSTVTASAPGYVSASIAVSLVINEANQHAPVLQNIGARTIIAGQAFTFTAVATDEPNQTKAFSLINAPAGATIGASSGVFNWTPAVAGSFVFTVRVTDNGSPVLSDEESVAITVLDPAVNDTVRINAGGAAFIASGNRPFIADKYFGGVERTNMVNGDILNTTDDVLYRSARVSSAFNYSIPVPNGAYKVVLHFAETYFGVSSQAPQGVGKRMFNVDVEGSRKLTNYDIFTKAGGAMRAIQETILVNVSDGALNINFLPGAADIPRIAAIEVLLQPVKTTVTLMTVADSYIRDGSYATQNFGHSSTLEAKSGAGSGLLRSIYLKFSLSSLNQVSSAKLRIHGYNWENNNSINLSAYGVSDDSWTETGVTWNNAPAGSATSLSSTGVNGTSKYYELDVTSFVNAQLSGDKVMSIMLKDPTNRNRRLMFNSKEFGDNPPQLVIETTGSVNSSARINQEITSVKLNDELKKDGSRIYPNPVQNSFTIELSDRHSDDISVDLIHKTGKIFKVNLPEGSKPGQSAAINISGLSISNGIYLLRVQSAAATEVIKMLVVD